MLCLDVLNLFYNHSAFFFCFSKLKLQTSWSSEILSVLEKPVGRGLPGRGGGVGGWGGGSRVCSSLEWSALSLWPKTHPPTPLPSSLLLPISSSSARSGPLGSLLLNDTSLLDLNGSPHLTVDRCAAGPSPPIALLIRRLWTASGSLFPVFLSTSVHHTAPYYRWSF